MDNSLKLANQVALVTGANSGIGKAIAIELGKQGAKIAVNYVSHGDTADEVVNIINRNGGLAMKVYADVSNEADVESMFRRVIEKFGTLDILINNAGLQQDAAFHEMTLAQWQLVINVNLTGQFLCSRAAVREFLKKGVVKEKSKAAGKIICMSSVHEVIPWGGHVNYAASKGGVELLMKSMAQELAPQKIRINSIGPGAIQTPINKSAWETPQALGSLLTLIPYQRIGQPEDVAKLAAWLASDDADYITGTTIFIDGGMTLYPGFSTNG